ncbi:MAG: ATP-binding cassette domain-containing protein [Phycisphaerales bacterium]
MSSTTPENLQGDSPEVVARPEPLLRVRDLRTWLPGRDGRVRRAVDGVSLDLGRADSLGLVGPSGCGKTTLARTVLALERATDGRVEFDGVSVFDAPPREQRRLRRRMQIVFQDPAGSLDPRMRIWKSVSEALEVHRIVSGRRALRDRAAALLERCGLDASALDRYPHEFSGGQRQRIAIARALAPDPALLVCDEPTSALDVSVQAQVLNLLQDLRCERGLAMLFISHDLAVVAHMCERVAVMEAGRIVRKGAAREVLASAFTPTSGAPTARC